jgi:hypothetical protein
MQREIQLVRVLIVVGLAASAALPHASAGLIADAGQDYQTSRVQGHNGWSYGYFDTGEVGTAYSSAGFQLMTLVGDRYWAADGLYWTGATGEWLHPNALNFSRRTDVHYAVRRWTSTHTGPVELSGLIRHEHATPLGDGTVTTIYVDGAEVFSYSLTPGNIVGDAYSVLADVEIGSLVEYVVSAGPNNHGRFDTTFLSSRITAVPGPGVGALALIGAAALGRRRRN